MTEDKCCSVMDSIPVNEVSTETLPEPISPPIKVTLHHVIRNMLEESEIQTK